MSVCMEVKVVATSADDLRQFVQLLQYIQGAGHNGSCEAIKVVVDGDGSGKYHFSDHTGEKLPSLMPPSHDTTVPGKEITVYLGE